LLGSAEESLDDEPVQRRPGGQEHGTRVLLVEDNEINRLVAVRMLEKHGFHVEVAANGRVALEMCRRRRYKAVFMDCHMPELDGYETTAEIRRNEGKGRHMPIIAMTANTMKGDREKCLAAGMDDYVGKPVDPEALTEAIVRSMDAGHASPDNGARGDDAGSAPGGTGPLLDRSALAELCEGDEEMLQELVSLFTGQMETLAADLGRAVESGDAEAVGRLAHHLKGSAANVGAVRVAELCARLYEAGRTGELSGAPEVLRELERAAELTRASWYSEAVDEVRAT
jgi:two-component system sensor histidine kinase/response regulator